MRVITRELAKEYMGEEKQIVTAQKIKDELGWKPTAIETTLKDSLEWIRNHDVKNG